jgi:hypothetical protein
MWQVQIDFVFNVDAWAHECRQLVDAGGDAAGLFGWISRCARSAQG